MNRKQSAPPRWWNKVTRDLVLFSFGLGLTVNEALFHVGPERPSLLILFAGMMGVPAMLKYDELRRGKRDEK